MLIFTGLVELYYIHKTYLKVGNRSCSCKCFVMDGATFPGKKAKIYDMIVNRLFLFLLKNANLPVGKDLLFMPKIE